MKKLGRLLLEGLVTLGPPVLTVYVLYWSGVWAENALGGAVRSAGLGAYYVPGLGVALLLVLLVLVGLLMRAWIVRRLVGGVHGLMKRIPLVKTLYGSIEDLLSFFSASQKEGMHQVCMVTLGDGRTRLLGFVTREQFGDLPAGIGGEDTVGVYLPMSYQIGGFTVYVSKSAVSPVDMSLEEGLRLAMTAGVSKEADDRAGREGS
jgi:uncharacterized membrane protein